MGSYKFATNLLIAVPYPPPVYKGLGWTVYFEYDSDGEKVARLTSDLSQMSARMCIQATSESMAHRALTLIIDCMKLYEAGNSIDSRFAECVPIQDYKNSTAPYLEVFSTGINSWNINQCEMAIRASRRLKYQYAIAKYVLSVSVLFVPFDGLDPKYWQQHPLVLNDPVHSVHCAAAITHAYSVLEELNVDIHASERRPSRLQDGSWNPLVKEDLEFRLRKARIDLSEKVFVVARGGPTKLEQKRPYSMKHSAKWAQGIIRDGYVDVVDAIAQLSWLRSKVSAHSISPLSTSLNIIEVFNAQNLARRLILESLGLWQYRNK